MREYLRAIAYPKIEAKIKRTANLFRVALTLGVTGELFYPERFDWPSLRDEGDKWLLDLAFAAKADFIVTRDKDLLELNPELGFNICSPYELVNHLNLDS